jgi:hypothetical protein
VPVPREQPAWAGAEFHVGGEHHRHTEDGWG